MNIKNWLIGGVAGGVTAFFLGFIFYGMLLSNYMEGQASVAGAMRADDDMVWWALIVGNLIYGLTICFIWIKWAGIKTFVTGLKGGAILGVLISLTSGLIMYATTNIAPMEMVFIDAALSTVIGGLVGGVVGQVLGSLDKG